MMKKTVFSLVLFLCALAVYAQNKQTVTKSSVTFKIKNLGINVGGSFGGVQADIHFDTANLDSSSITATVEANTVNTDNNMRDEHLRGEDFFDVAKYPKITMKSVSFKHKSGNNYTGVFNLTIKDKTKQVEMPFTYTENSGSAEFKGMLKINRQDYGVGGSGLIMSKDVQVDIDITTTK